MQKNYENVAKIWRNFDRILTKFQQNCVVYFATCLCRNIGLRFFSVGGWSLPSALAAGMLRLAEEVRLEPELLTKRGVLGAETDTNTRLSKTCDVGSQSKTF